ncbi:kinase-like domain-containing protein [Lasiosphaeris hirsuta]|uniref:Kinase-like domain-containing protein n=1 Tax=Lasiosphaeris hirsuta TaxID=260670 RepID=A0AA40ANY3_9PEZI|nr:kinase-like domain-containing protein [Lasiosphaeris hirsuta]
MIEARSPERSQQIFDEEYHANRRIRVPHAHITPLLTAFQYGDTRWCLLFPWADGGSLRELWRDIQPPRPVWCSADWLRAQCLGISQGLLHMHQPPETQDGGVSQLHADIKPENILCFSTAPSSGGSFVLKLADLGLAQPAEGGYLATSKIKHTLTYRPPEQDLGGPGASLKWDVWCLGCLFLEFITWFVQGTRGVEDFQTVRESEQDDPRASETETRTFEDKFFRIKISNRILSRVPGVDVKKSARVKKCVASMDPRCSSDLCNILDFIESSMLAVDDHNRSNMEQVVEHLQA